MPGFVRARNSYLEDYQPTLAVVLASCLAAPEIPTAWDCLRRQWSRRKPSMGRSSSSWLNIKPKLCVQPSIFTEILVIPWSWLLSRCWNPEELPRPFSMWPEVINIMLVWSTGSPIRLPQHPPSGSRMATTSTPSSPSSTRECVSWWRTLWMASVLKTSSKHLNDIGFHTLEFLLAWWPMKVEDGCMMISKNGQTLSPSNMLLPLVKPMNNLRWWSADMRSSEKRWKSISWTLDLKVPMPSDRLSMALLCGAPAEQHPFDFWVFACPMGSGSITDIPCRAPWHQFDSSALGYAIWGRAVPQSCGKDGHCSGRCWSEISQSTPSKNAGTNIVLSPGQTASTGRMPEQQILWKSGGKGQPRSGCVRMTMMAVLSNLLDRSQDPTSPMRSSPCTAWDWSQCTSTLLGDLQVAKDVLQDLKSRGVTRYSDLTIKSKCDIDDVDSGDEMMNDGDSDDDHPPSPKRRLVDPAVYERESLGLCELEDIEQEMERIPAPPSVPYSPSAASITAPDAEQQHPIGFRDQHQVPPGLEEPAAGGDPPGLAVDTSAPGLGLVEPEQPSGGEALQPDVQGDEVPFSIEPSREPSPRTPQPPRLPQASQSLHPTSLRQLKNFELTDDGWNDKKQCLLDLSEAECSSPPMPLHPRPCLHPTLQCQLLPWASKQTWHGALFWSSQRRRPWTFGLRAWQPWPWIFGLWHWRPGAHCSSSRMAC